MSEGAPHVDEVYRGLFTAIASVLAEHDPARITQGNPDPVGEYEPEAREIARQILSARDPLDGLGDIVGSALTAQFGDLPPVREATLEGLTADISREYRAHAR